MHAARARAMHSGKRRVRERGGHGQAGGAAHLVAPSAARHHQGANDLVFGAQVVVCCGGQGSAGYATLPRGCCDVHMVRMDAEVSPDAMVPQIRTSTWQLMPAESQSRSRKFEKRCEQVGESFA